MADLARFEDVAIALGGATVVSGVSFAVRAGEVVALLGANGAGKSSLLRAALGVLPVTGGLIEVGGRDASQLHGIARARALAYLPQARDLAWPLLVADLVALGRFGAGGRLGRLGEEDRAAVDRALAACDLVRLAGRRTDTLSGGEQARAHLARALASGAPLLLADEPVASLDPKHQHEVMAAIAAYAAQGGGALVVLHDPGLAAAYATRLAWLSDGRLVADGPPAETLTPERLAEVYGLAADVLVHAGRHIVAPRP